jgi:nitrogen-specific signal transduction histidine kinase
VPQPIIFILGLAAGVLLSIPIALLIARASIRRARGSERRARQAEHLAEVGTLTGGLAHEIRNPLSTLNLNLQLLR